MLPALPFPLWSRCILEGISNTIGRFVAVEEDFMHSFDKRMENILVELDISDGLPADIEILYLDRLFT